MDEISSIALCLSKFINIFASRYFRVWQTVYQKITVSLCPVCFERHYSFVMVHNHIKRTNISNLADCYKLAARKRTPSRKESSATNILRFHMQITFVSLYLVDVCGPSKEMNCISTVTEFHLVVQNIQE